MSIFDRDHYRGCRQQYKNHWLSAFDKARKPGFPQDDEFSLMQGDLDGGCCNLDMYYPHQFIQNETTNQCKDGIRSNFQLEYTPVLDNTLTCTVYIGKNAVQTGYLKNGGMIFDKIGNPEIFAEAGNINLDTGELCVRFNKQPPENCLVVSYEYNMECQFSDQ